MENCEWNCNSCGNEYEPETLLELEAAGQEEEEKELNWEYRTEAEGASRTEDGRYICPSCK